MNQISKVDFTDLKLKLKPRKSCIERLIFYIIIFTVCITLKL